MKQTSTERTSSDTPRTVAQARAFAYLRVSSEGQVNTGYSRDGLSIDAQREAIEQKADQLGASVERVFVDPGKSAFVDLHRRTEFLELLDELARRNRTETERIDWVIVYSSSRWARSVEDHFRTSNMVRAAGARLVSVTEPMIGENTPESFFMEGMFALNNQYESMKTGRNVSTGIYQKAKGGGTYGGRRLGYIRSVEQLPDGRTIGCVVPDPERSSYVTYAFKAYASGECSIPQLCDELYQLGLRSFPSRRYEPGKVGTSAMQRMLRNPFYAGLIVYKKGTPDEQAFTGRHQALTTPEIFKQVQSLLDEKRVACERPQIHRPFLSGSVFCSSCKQRLSYGVSTGRNGSKYAYYFCSSRINGTSCSQRTNMRPDAIDKAIEDEYLTRPVQLTIEDAQRRIDAIEALVKVSQHAVATVKAAKTELIANLRTQQTRLIRLHAEEGDAFSPDAFRAERARMQADIEAAELSLAETESKLAFDASLLRMALELATGVGDLYAKADKAMKRRINQAFFKKLLVTPEWDDETGETVVRVVDAELTEPYQEVLSAGFVRDVEHATASLKSAARTEDGSEPPSARAVSIIVKLAEREGFEPSNEVDPRYAISSRARSTAPAPLQERTPHCTTRARGTRAAGCTAAPLVARLRACCSRQTKRSSRRSA